MNDGFWHLGAYRCYGLLYAMALQLVFHATLQRHPSDVRSKIWGWQMSAPHFLMMAALTTLAAARLGSLISGNFPIQRSTFWAPNTGMSFFGGLIGFATWLFLIHGFDFKAWFEMTDPLVRSLPWAIALVRLGNHVNGELYGTPTRLWWGHFFNQAPDGGVLRRHPVSCYEMILEGPLLWFWIYSQGQPKRRGWDTRNFCLGYGLFRALVECVREPDFVLSYGGRTLNLWQIMALILTVVAILLPYDREITSKRSSFKQRQADEKLS